MLWLVCAVGVVLAHEDSDAKTIVVAPDCRLAVKAARRYEVHIHDIDDNGVIDIEDVGPYAIDFGMHWADTNHDEQLSHKEVAALFARVVPLWARVVSAWLSLFSSKYSLEQVFTDCDADRDGAISLDDYRAARHTTCMETCGKAEDVFNYLGIKFGAIQ